MSLLLELLLSLPIFFVLHLESPQCLLLELLLLRGRLIPGLLQGELFLSLRLLLLCNDLLFEFKSLCIFILSFGKILTLLVLKHAHCHFSILVLFLLQLLSYYLSLLFKLASIPLLEL